MSEIETGVAEKPSWDQTNRRQKLGLVWRNRKKISQIIKDYFCLPFFLLIILWVQPSQRGFFRVHTFVWREREPEPNFQTFQGPRHQFHGIQITWPRESLALYKSFKPLWADIQREIPLWHGAWKLDLFYILALSTLWLIPFLRNRFCLVARKASSALFLQIKLTNVFIFWVSAAKCTVVGILPSIFSPNRDDF